MAWGGAPKELVAFWSKFLDDEMDLAGYYSSEASVRLEIDGHPDIETYADAAVDAWKTARSHRDTVTDARALVLASETYGETASASSSDVVKSLKPINRKVDMSFHAANHPPKQTRVTEATRADNPRQLMYEIWRRVGPAGLKWIPAEKDETEEQKRLFLNNIKHFKDPALAAHIRGMKRWYKWADDYAMKAQREVDPHKPSVLVLGTFLATAGKGKTSGLSMANDMAWWYEHIGVPMPIKDRSLSAFFKVEPGHTTDSGKAMSITTFLAFCLHAHKDSTGTIGEFCSGVVLLATVCIRYIHSTRSVVNELSDKWVSATCQAGKRKVQGSQVAFDWLAPRCGLPGMDTSRPILRVLRSLQDDNNRHASTAEQITFIIPDMNIAKGEPIGRNTQWLNRAMPPQKFNEVLSAVAAALGCPPQVASKLTGKSLRKNLPSGAAALLFDREEKQSIGNWQDVPEDDGDKKSKKQRAQFPMSHTYAEDEVLGLTAGHNKMKILAAYYNTFKAEITADKVDMNCSGWKELREKNYSKDQLQEMISAESDWVAETTTTTSRSVSERQQTSDSPVASTYQIAFSPEKVSPEKIIATTTEVVDTSSDSDTESVTSASSVMSHDSARAINTMAWFTQPAHGRNQLIHIVEDEEMGLLIPFCRDTAFAQGPEERGFGAHAAASLAAHMCPTCLRKQPINTQKSLIEIFK